MCGDEGEQLEMLNKQRYFWPDLGHQPYGTVAFFQAFSSLPIIPCNLNHAALPVGTEVWSGVLAARILGRDLSSCEQRL